MVVKMIGLGTSLSINGTTIGGLISLPGPDGSADDIDTSTIDNETAFKTFQRGQVDPGEMTLSLAYDPGSASAKKLGSLYASGEIVTFSIAFPSTSAPGESFDGYVKGMGRAIEKDAMITQSVTIKVTDDPGFPST